MKELSQLAIDIYLNKTGDFSREEAEESLRQALIDLCGTDKPDYKTMRRFKPEVFEILEEALDVLVSRNIEEEFGKFAEYRNLSWGDSKRFVLKNPNLFKVAVVSHGSGNLRRQRLEDGSIEVDTYMRGIKIYEELYRFLAGRIDWVELVNRVSQSYNNEIYTSVYKAIYDSYNNLSATYGVTGTYDATTLGNLIQHVEAANGARAVIYGAKNALGKVTDAVVSDTRKEVFNMQGYYGVFRGTEMQEIKQAHIPGTDTFAINDSFLIIIPQGDEKIVKIVDEGDSIIRERLDGANMDYSIEYEFLKSSGIAVVTAAKFGIYRLS